MIGPHGGYALRNYIELDSTNAEAERLAQAGERGPIWIHAQRQTSGKGRRGRAWLGAEQDLCATLLLTPKMLRPQVEIGEAATLSFVACLAVADLIDHFAPNARVGLKWPNDALVDERKIAGVLLQAQDDWVAIGVGVNLVSAPPAEKIEPGAWPATCLADHRPAAPSCEDALDVLAEKFDRWLKVWADEGFAGLRMTWLSRAARLGEQILARVGQEEVEGRFADVDASGALVLETQDGFRQITAADVFYK